MRGAGSRTPIGLPAGAAAPVDDELALPMLAGAGLDLQPAELASAAAAKKSAARLLVVVIVLVPSRRANRLPIRARGVFP
jgi:hypothetical protein